MEIIKRDRKGKEAQNYPFDVYFFYVGEDIK